MADGLDVGHGRMLSDKDAEALLKSPILLAAIARIADRVRDAANAAHNADGYRSSTRIIGDRVQGSVWTGDRHTIFSNRKHNTLIQVLGSAGRG